MRPLFRSLTASTLALSLAACSALPTPLDRPGDVPTDFTAPQTDNPIAPLWPETTWWANFQSEELSPLEELAQKENLDIAIYRARVIQAEAADGVAFAGVLPTASFADSYTHTQGSTPVQQPKNNFRFGLTASYQQNIFGQQYYNLEAARQNLRAARYAQAVIGISVAATVADQYFIILSLRERIAISRANIEAAKRILAITQAKVSSGVSSNLDLAQQQGIVAQQESLLPGLIQQEREARYALAILLGRAPEGFDVKAQRLDIVSPAVKPGLPSEVLLRRPDVANAEAVLYAAHANVDAARAAFFPTISLSGGTAYATTIFENLFNPTSFVWTLSTSITQTIFGGGAIRANLDLQKGREAEMIATYRKTVFTAFSEVETALGRVQATGEQLERLDAQVKAYAEAFRISELQYREGTIDILALLNNQQQLFSAQNAFVQTKLARLEANLSLYQSLGGGWTQKADDESYQYQLDWWPL